MRNTTETSRSQVANIFLRDSTWLHDSIRVEYRRGSPLTPRTENKTDMEGNSLPHPVRVDTVYLEKWHTRWRDRETIRADTITNEVIRTETLQVRYIPRFYKYCTVLAILLLLFLLARAVLYLYRRWG